MPSKKWATVELLTEVTCHTPESVKQKQDKKTGRMSHSVQLPFRKICQNIRTFCLVVD